jgi:hypothetical protein
VYQFSCVVSPAQVTVATERAVQLAATVVALPINLLVWSAAGGFSNDGTVGHNTVGGALQAPSWHSGLQVEILAASELDPSRFGIAR